MTADLLHRAAALMRERGESTTPHAQWTDGHYWIADHDEFGDAVQTEIGGMGGRGDAAHYSSWHPAVALAVADWLDMAADHEAGRGDPCASCQTQALVVARGYLGEEAPC